MSAAPRPWRSKIARTVRTLGIQRFDMKYSTGPMPHADLMTCIRLYGEKVIPMVRDMLADKAREALQRTAPRCCVPRLAASNIWR